MAETPGKTHSGFGRLLGRITPVRDREVAALLWGFGQIFCLIAGHYVLRSVRDSLGSARGSADLRYLYLGTFALTIVAVTGWSALVARFRARGFVPIAYEFFAVSFVIFWALLSAGVRGAGYSFFVWYSVYNVFVVSVFWSRAADLFTHEQGKRLFPFMAGGGSLGAICGSALSAGLVDLVGTVNLLLIPILLLQGAVLCSRRLSEAAALAASDAAAPGFAERAGAPVRGNIRSGLRGIIRSPYLTMIAVYILLATFCGTCVYNAQSDLARAAYPDRDDRTGYFARVDLAVNCLAFLSEVFLTARIIGWIGLGAALLLLPAVYVIGFPAAAWNPTLIAVAALSIAQRSVGYGITSPSREALFTVVAREEKYRAKSVIDTFVWRVGDVAAVWLIAGLVSLTSGDNAPAAAKAVVMVTAGIPFALVWLLAAWRLRRLHREQAAMHQVDVVNVAQ